jgi:hypothetical protein
MANIYVMSRRARCGAQSASAVRAVMSVCSSLRSHSNRGSCS